MDAFSISSLTTVCSTISHRCASGAEELKGVVEDSGPEGKRHALKLSSMIDTLQSLHRCSMDLSGPLSTTLVISSQLQQILEQTLGSCDAATASLQKQLMRLQSVNVGSVDSDALDKYADMLLKSTGLFEHFIRLLSMSEKGQQDTALDASQIQDAIRDAKIAYESTSNQHDILSGFDSETTHYASVSTNRTNHDNADLNVADGTEPPAYSEEATSSEKAKPKTGFSWGMSSIKQSLVALASSLQPKPGPFVSAMCQAASRGDVQQVAGFLAQGANINGLNEDSNTALTCAILANQESSVRLLMASGASLKSSNWSSLPPLFLAASVGSTDVAQLLLNRGARVDEASITGQPYFVDVVTAGNVDGIKFLLENGARANTAHISGRLVIAHAVSSGNPEVVKLLLKFGADVNSKDITGSSLLAMALEGKDPVMPELLLKMGANANSNTIAGISLLADQILRRQLNLVELLVMSGADPNALDWQRQPILLVVLKDVKIKREEKICIVRVLLTHGALTNASDPTWGRPAIYYAMKTGVAELVGLLLENGAKLKPTITMDSGESLLTYAINEGRNDLVKLLLEHGADPNKTGESDKTPLVSGLIKQGYELVKLLREAGADTSATEVRDFAESLGRPDIMRLLGLEDNVPAIPAREHGTSTPPPDYASSQK